MKNKCIQACVVCIDASTQTVHSDFNSLQQVSIYEQYHQLSNMYPNDINLIYLSEHSIRFELRLRSLTDDQLCVSSVVLIIGGPTYSIDVQFCTEFLKDEKQEIESIITQSKPYDLLEMIIQVEAKLTEFDGEFKKRREQSLLVSSTQNIPIELQLTRAISKSYADFTEESDMKQSYYGIDRLKEQLAEKYDNTEPKLINASLPSPIEQILQLQTCSISRFNSDFDEIELIGSGGFGKVFKSRNKFDGNYYALKRIALDYSNKKLTEKTKNEAVLLSRIQHPNIVRYFQAWVEEYVKDEYENLEDDDYEESDEESESEETETIQRRGSEEEEQYEYVYEYVEEDVQIDWMGDGQQDVPEESLQTPQVKHNQKENKQLLYIQMEYCTGDTLKKKIDERKLNSDQKRKIIRQVLDALYYLHKNNIIHRDLKPQNIFLDGDLNVKLGDFGLATEMKQEIKQLDNKFMRNSINPQNSSLTQGVGTFLYLAPEQENSHYDAKADIYSLGIILFEMYYPFKTDFERIQSIKQLRELGKFPLDFEQKVGMADLEIREKIALLVNKNPEKRPSTQELLNKYKDQRLQQVIRSIANPNCPDFYELVQTLFDCKQLKQQNNFITSCLEEALSKSRDLQGFQTNLTELYSRVDKIFRIHGGLLVNLSPLLPAQNTIKYQTFDDKIIEYEFMDQSFRFITQQGELVQFCSNLLQPTIYWLKLLPLNNFRRYTIGEVQHANQQSLAKQYCASYDIISEVEYYPYIELLSISNDIVHQLSDIINFELKISHAQLFELILLELGFNSQMILRMQRDQIFLRKLMKYTHNSKENEATLLKTLNEEFNFTDDKAKKFLMFISLKKHCNYSDEEILKRRKNESGKKVDVKSKRSFCDELKCYFTKYQDKIQKIIKQIEKLEHKFQKKKLFKDIRVVYEVFQMNELTCYYSGITFEFVEISLEQIQHKDFIQQSRSEPVEQQNKLLKRHLKSNATVFIIGGNYSHQINNKESEHHKYASGIHVYLDQLYYSRFLKYLSINQTCKNLKPFNSMPKSSGVVIITDHITKSKPYFIAQQFWSHKVPAIVVDSKHSKNSHLTNYVELKLNKKQETWKAFIRRAADKKEEEIQLNEIYDKCIGFLNQHIEQQKNIKRAQSRSKQQ